MFLDDDGGKADTSFSSYLLRGRNNSKVTKPMKEMSLSAENFSILAQQHHRIIFLFGTSYMMENFK